MAKQEQIQHRPRRHREEDSAPEPYTKSDGASQEQVIKNIDRIVEDTQAEIDRQLKEQDRFRNLGHLGVVA